jgi:aromatic ring-opening dioxygenase LigB subunit
MLLDQAGYTGNRVLQAVGEGEPAGQCAQLGAALAAAGESAAMLVLGDGSARRSVAAPGHLDERAVPFDDEVVRAVRDGDLPALAALDPGLARELMVTGRPAWQVLCGALGPGRPVTEVLYTGAPFGVAYLVARIDPGGRVASSAQRRFSPK